MKMIINIASVVAGIVLTVATASAAVVDSTSSGFTIRHEQRISGDKEILFNQFYQDIGEWWDPSHTWSGKASNLSIQPWPGGCFCEELDNGGQIRHLAVIYVDPGKVFRMEGGLGPLQQFAVNGVLTLELTSEGESVKATLTYSVGGYIPGGVAKFAAAVDRVLGEQFRRFGEYAGKK